VRLCYPYYMSGEFMHMESSGNYLKLKISEFLQIIDALEIIISKKIFLDQIGPGINIFGSQQL
jgi:hypothetical protein